MNSDTICILNNNLSYEYTRNTVLYYVVKVTFDVVHVMFHASKGKFEILTPRKPISTQNNVWLMIVINEFLGNTVNSAANKNQIFFMFSSDWFSEHRGLFLKFPLLFYL